MEIVTLYLSAWTTYFFHAQTDAEFNLPYNPSRVLKINVVTAGHIIGWITYLPMIFSYLYWRYWEVGNERFKEIVRCVCIFLVDFIIVVVVKTHRI